VNLYKFHLNSYSYVEVAQEICNRGKMQRKCAEVRFHSAELEKR
jgi:hypothetical protein